MRSLTSHTTQTWHESHQLSLVTEMNWCGWVSVTLINGTIEVWRYNISWTAMVMCVRCGSDTWLMWTHGIMQTRLASVNHGMMQSTLCQQMVWCKHTLIVSTHGIMEMHPGYVNTWYVANTLCVNTWSDANASSLWSYGMTQTHLAWVDWLAVSLRRVGSISHIHSKTWLGWTMAWCKYIWLMSTQGMRQTHLVCRMHLASMRWYDALTCLLSIHGLMQIHSACVITWDDGSTLT